MKTGLSFILSLIALWPLMSCAETKSSNVSKLTPTIYYKPVIQYDRQKCSSNRLKDMKDPDGKTLITICDTDFDRCLMQGSCFVHEEDKIHSFNYHSTKGGIARFVEVDIQACPYGYGVKSSCLDPYFSVAADLSLYKAGDVIFVPRLVGVRMPNGEIHDGFLVIRDSGGKIKGRGRFDFFTGFYNHLDKENVMVHLGFSDSNHRYEYRLAKPNEAAATRQRRAYPKLKPQSHYEAEEMLQNTQN